MHIYACGWSVWPGTCARVFSVCVCLPSYTNKPSYCARVAVEDADIPCTLRTCFLLKLLELTLVELQRAAAAGFIFSDPLNPGRDRVNKITM